MEDCLKQKNLLRFDLWFIKTITLGNLSTFTFSTSDNGSNMEKALKAIDKTVEFFNSLGIPTRLREYGNNIDLEFTVKEIISRFESRNIRGLGENGIVSLEDI